MFTVRNVFRSSVFDSLQILEHNAATVASSGIALGPQATPRSTFRAPTKPQRSSLMPWHPSSPDADHRHVQSRMLRSIAAAILPVLTITASYGANTRFTPISTFPSRGDGAIYGNRRRKRRRKARRLCQQPERCCFSPFGQWQRIFFSASEKTIVALPAGSYPILTADFDRDGKPDLAVLQPGRTRVLIYLGRGDGTFGARSSSSMLVKDRSTWRSEM